MLEVFLYPVQFNPQKKLMYFYHGIDLRVEYSGTVVENENGLGPFEGIGREILLNYPGIDLESGREDTAAVHYYTDLLDTANVADYIIVTHYDFLNNKTSSEWIQDFAEWRVEHNEFDIGIVKVQDIYSYFPPADSDSLHIPVRDFLVYAYDNWKAPSMPDDHFAYCLFIGDWDYVPTKLYTYPLNSEIWLAANEEYFRNFSGGWGEEIMLGRLPVKETRVQDLVTVAQKTINYESEPDTGNWRRRGFLIAGDDFDYYVTLSKPYFTDINYDTLVTCYSQIQNDSQFRAAIDNNLNAGEILTSYYGHGGPTGWWGREMGAHYSSLRVKKLKNGSRLPVVLSFSCFTAMFQWDHPFYDSTHSFPADTSFGEHFLIKQNGGAVAFYGATRVTGGLSLLYGLNFLNNVLRHQSWILGKSLVNLEYNIDYCLLGDPALDLGDYTAYPNLPDLVIRPQAIDISLLPPYPYLSICDTIPIQSIVWNIGGTAAYDVDVRFRVLCDEQLIYDTTVTIDTILPRDSVTVTVYWNTGSTHPNYYGEIGDCEFKIRADPNHSIQESWEYNNESMIIKNVAIYPHQPGWPKKIFNAIFTPQPAVANLDVSGSMEIICPGDDSIYVFNYDGSIFGNWPQYFKDVYGVVLGDVDNNDTIEIVAVSPESIKVYDYQGEILYDWPVKIPHENMVFRGYPALGHISGSQYLNVVVFTVPTSTQSFDSLRVLVYGYGGGSLLYDFGISVTPGIYYSSGVSISNVKAGAIDEIVISYEPTAEKSGAKTCVFDSSGLVDSLAYGSSNVTSALVDINNDNYADVIIGCSDGKIRAYDVENDTLLWERQTEGPISSSPAVGDIHPGIPYPGVEVTFGNNASRIHLREKEGGYSIDPWPYLITPSTYIRTSPAIANINGDDYLDIIIGDYKNYIYAFNYNGSSITPFPLPLFGEFSSPIIGDIDGDRRSEIIVSSSDGYLHVWENMDSEVSSYLLEWPQFHHDYQRTGLYSW